MKINFHKVSDTLYHVTFNDNILAEIISGSEWYIKLLTNDLYTSKQLSRIARFIDKLNSQV